MERAVIIIVLAALQAVFGIPDFLRGSEDYWLRATTYSFFHAGWLHLAVNSLAAWSIFRPGRRWMLTLLAAYAIAVAVYPLSLRPVIGFSNVLYAVLGLQTPPLRSAWWKQPTVITFLVVTVAMLFIPRFSATTHIAAFALGMAGAALHRKWNLLTRDCRRYL